MEMHNILVPLDFSRHSEHALMYARALAKKTGATVHCAHVSESDFIEFDAAQELYRARAEESKSPLSIQGQIEAQLDAAVETVARQGVAVARHARVGKPHEQVLELVSDLDIDFIVMGTHGLTGAERLGRGSPGSVYAKIRATTDVPVLAVKSPEREFVTEDGAFSLKTVACPCDLSDLSQHAVPIAVYWCRTFGAKLFLVHVAHTYVEYKALNPNPAERHAHPELQGTEERLHALAAKHEAPSYEVVTMKADHTARTLRDALEEREVGLVVMTTHGRSGLRKALLGSVAEEVIPHLNCPVLTIRPAASS